MQELRAKLLETLAKLPWTRIGPYELKGEGAKLFEVRIAELPDFFVVGRTEEKALREARPALRAFLESYLDRDELPPAPQSDWFPKLPRKRARTRSR